MRVRSLKRVFLLAFGLFHAPLGAQPTRPTCACAPLLEETIRTVTTVYAGYDDKVTPHTRPPYARLLARLRREAPRQTTGRGCYEILRRYTAFFHDSHVGAWFGLRSSPDRQRVVAVTNARARVSHRDQHPDSAGLRGVWATADGRQRYAIVRDPTHGDQLVAVTLATGDTAWAPGMVKVEFYRYEPRFGWYQGMYYRPDFSGVLDGFTLHGDRLDHWFGASWYRHVAGHDAGAPPHAPGPTVQLTVLGHDDLYLKLASFNARDVTVLDSVLRANRSLIATTPNLIFDLRGNPGGDGSSSTEMLRLIYTNPIVYPAWQYRSSPELVRSTQASIASLAKGSADTEWMLRRQQHLLARLVAHPGQLVRGGDDVVRTVDSVPPFPRRVAFLLDRGSGSSTEFFTFEGKQSTKVTTFGSNTFGVMDYGEAQQFRLACGEYQISVPWGRNGWIDRFGYRIDNVGFSPEVRIPAGEPDPVGYIVRYWSK